MSIPFADLFFLATLESPRHGLRYLGPTLRGAFGYVLKEAVCQVSHGQCEHCVLRQVCPYPTIFEGRPPEDRTLMRRYPAVPQPFVLVVAGPSDWWGRPDELRWGLRLFGPARHQWPYLIEAFTRVGSRGIGRQRTRFDLKSVVDARSGQAVWSAGETTLRNVTQEDQAHHGKPPPNSDVLRWTFETPVHIRQNGDFASSLGGLSLVLAGRRRWDILRYLYSSQERSENATNAGAHLKASDFEVLESSLKPWSIRRYSGRQGKKVPLRGLIGQIVIRGAWDQAGDWLRYIQQIHLGKHGSFGFGRGTWAAL